MWHSVSADTRYWTNKMIEIIIKTDTPDGQKSQSLALPYNMSESFTEFLLQRAAALIKHNSLQEAK